MFSHLFRMVRLFHPSIDTKKAKFQSQCTWRRNEPQHHGLSRHDLEKILVDPDWTKAVFYRDPVSRFVSAFQSKCGHVDEDGQKHCEAAFGPNVTGSVEDFRKAVDEMAMFPEKRKQAFHNPHFAPMARFCGGLKHTLDYYDFVHLLDKKTAPDLVRQLLLHIGVKDDDVEYLIENVVRTGGTHVGVDSEEVEHRLGIRLHKSQTNKASHNTGSRKSFDEYFEHAGRVQLLQHEYKMDYDLFGLPKLDLEDLETWLQVGGNTTAMIAHEKRDPSELPCETRPSPWDTGV